MSVYTRNTVLIANQNVGAAKAHPASYLENTFETLPLPKKYEIREDAYASATSLAGKLSSLIDLARFVGTLRTINKELYSKGIKALRNGAKLLLSSYKNVHMGADILQLNRIVGTAVISAKDHKKYSDMFSKEVSKMFYSKPEKEAESQERLRYLLSLQAKIHPAAPLTQVILSRAFDFGKQTCLKPIRQIIGEYEIALNEENQRKLDSVAELTYKPRTEAAFSKPGKDTELYMGNRSAI